MFNPNDFSSLTASIKQAFSKERKRARERTPNAGENNQGKYPMRNVQEFPGGHRITFDSTPEHRIMERFHGSGTFEQWAEDGSETKICVGNVHEHIKEGYTLTIDQNGDIKIDGHARVSVGGGVHIEIKGDSTLYCQGDWTHYVGGNYNLVVTGDLNLSSGGNHNVATAKNRSVKIKGNDTNNIDGTSDEKSGGTMTKIAPKIDLNP